MNPDLIVGIAFVVIGFTASGILLSRDLREQKRRKGYHTRDSS